MLGGYTGKILWVNLTNGKAVEKELTTSFAKKFLGGKGFGAKVLLDTLKPGINPLDPENVLIFVTGPLTGTMMPTSSKFGVIFKSPLTNTFSDSYCGGHLALELKYAGYDAIVVYGKAKKPVYIWIDDARIELKDANHLWGKDTLETERMIKEELRDSKIEIACIGPAGEKLVRFACICHRVFRHAGRGGAGAVMGSKNLKAIAVRGTREVRVANTEEFIKCVDSIYEVMKKDPQVRLEWEGYLRYGTPGLVDIINMAGIFPTENFQHGVFKDANKIDAEFMVKNLVIKNSACFGCPIQCAKLSFIKTGRYAGTFLIGPEYETICLLGSCCGINNLNIIVKANELCDRLGLDTISCGNVIAFGMECYEKGIITEKLAGGLNLRFGNEEALLEIIKKIAKREGLGDLLADGVERASRKLGGGSKRFAMHVKGLEIPAYDPRGALGMGLAYATSDRGACHLRAIYVLFDEIGGTIDRYSTKGKAERVKENQDSFAVLDSLILCKFINAVGIGMDWYAKILSATTGKKVDDKDLYLVGERIYNLTRIFNVREGFTKQNDTLPQRLLQETLPSGPAKGHLIKERDLDEMLDDYYRLRGWDREGKPTKQKLEELGLLKNI